MEKIKLQGLDEEIYSHIDKSGLVIYMWVNKKVNSCYYALNVKYGSLHTKFKVKNKKYEVPKGIAHFIEHIKFNIAKDKSVHEDFYKLGADANAFTTFKYTSYVVFTSSKQKENLNKLLDFVYNPYFTKKTVAQEKGIIVEEANMLQDNPLGESYYAFLKNIFVKYGYRNYITGAEKDIKDITLEDVLDVYNNYYHPQNMFLCVTGNFKPYEIIKIVEENMSQKSFSEYSNVKNVNVKETAKVNKKYEVLEKNVAEPKLRYGIKIPLKNLQNYNKSVLQIILNLIISSNLGATSSFKDNIIMEELATYFYPSLDIYDDYALLAITAESEYIEELIKKIDTKIKHLSIIEKDILRKKKAMIAALILAFDDIESVALSIEDEIIQYGEIQTNTKELLENITIDMVKDVFNKLDLSQKSILVIKPKKQVKKTNDIS